MLSCTVDLSKNKDDLCIHRVDQYNQRNKQNKPLSDSLVPIGYKIDLVFAAIEKPDVLNHSVQIPVDEDKYLLYDENIGANGLTWSELLEWYNNNHLPFNKGF